MEMWAGVECSERDSEIDRTRERKRRRIGECVLCVRFAIFQHSWIVFTPRFICICTAERINVNYYL